MVSEPAAAPKSNGLSVLWDIVVAPGAAFAALRERPTAGWAFIVTSVLFAIGAIVLIPVNQHISEVTLRTMAAHNPQIAALTPEQQARQLAFTKAIQAWIWIAGPLFVAIGASITALLLLIGNAIGRGDGNFRRFFALAMNIAVIYFGIGYIVIAIVATLRGPSSFSTASDLASAVPSLGWLAPGAPAKLATFLGALNIFNLWSMVLTALGMQTVARVSPMVAWITAIVIVAGSAAFGAAFAQ